MNQYIQLCKIVMSLQEIVKYSHCFVKFYWPGLMYAPSGSLRFLLVSELPFSAVYPTVWEYSPSSFFYGLTTIEVYCNFRVAGVNIFYRIYYKNISLYNDHLYFINTLFIKTQGGYLSLNVISNDFYKKKIFSLTLTILQKQIFLYKP